jgi:hypothetical protein
MSSAPLLMNTLNFFLQAWILWRSGFAGGNIKGLLSCIYYDLVRNVHFMIGNVRRRSGCPKAPKALEEIRYQDHLVHPRRVDALSISKKKITETLAGHSLETFPDQMAAVRDAGHEMFVHPLLSK